MNATWTWIKWQKIDGWINWLKIIIVFAKITTFPLSDDELPTAARSSDSIYCRSDGEQSPAAQSTISTDQTFNATLVVTCRRTA